MLAKMKVPNAMLGIAVIGIGASPIVDASPNAWDWALMALTSLAGGISLSASFLTNDGQAASARQPNHATRAPQSGGGEGEGGSRPRMDGVLRQARASTPWDAPSVAPTHSYAAVARSLMPI